MDRHQQSSRTLQETVTTLPAAEVLQAAKAFFARRNPIYAAFLEKEGPTHAVFRGQGGEEIVVGVTPSPSGATRVTASTYMFDQQVARFFATLPAAPNGENASAATAVTQGAA